MSNSSSSTLRKVIRRTVYGVPTKCWCGQGLDVWVSETKENPCRRFYRCKIALQNKAETHLFKWIDEALLDEIRMVDAKRLDVLHDLQALTADINLQRSLFLGVVEDMRKEMKENMLHLTKSLDEATEQMKEQIDEKISSHIFSKTAAAVAIFGVMTYLYCKLL